MLNISTKSALSKLKGYAESLCILTKSSNTRFEFIFTQLSPGVSQLFPTVNAVFKAYDSSRAYRELRLRSSLFDNGKLILLPREKLFEKIDGVWNLSSDQGNLGILHVTNIRVLWSSTLNAYFNISLPYLHLSSVRIGNSKFGKVLVICTSKQAGAYVLGFRIDPQEKLETVRKQVSSFQQLYLKNPIFGIEIDHSLHPEKSPTKIDSEADDVQIDSSSGHRDALYAYLAERNKSTTHEPVYNEQLGLAIERLPDGYTLDDLWLVFPPETESN
ncbi:unnamed protein product [Calicophoron daubneyi]|uniref:BBSome complex member BBS5 PH domain-containing protein n=1 Tax=Calicophoron daubneyi TaxID=300641 RepID=A0AAV2TEQ0_CALDB